MVGFIRYFDDGLLFSALLYGPTAFSFNIHVVIYISIEVMDSFLLLGIEIVNCQFQSNLNNLVIFLIIRL